MSHEVVKAVMDTAPASMGKSAYSALLSLAEWADKNAVVEPQWVVRVTADGERKEGIPAIAGRAHISQRQAERALSELKGEGWLDIWSGRGPGKGNRYRINLEALRRSAIAELESERQQEATKPAIAMADITDGKPAILEVKPAIHDNKTRHSYVGFKPDIAMAHHPSSPPESTKDESRGSRSRLTRESTPQPRTNFNPVGKEFSGRRPASYSNGAHSPPSVSATKLPLDFVLTPEQLTAAEFQVTEHAVTLDVRLSFKKFRNYYLRGNGKAVELDDWEGRWERWLLDDIDRLLAQAAEKRGQDAPTHRRRDERSSGESAKPGVGEPNAARPGGRGLRPIRLGT